MKKKGEKKKVAKELKQEVELVENEINGLDTKSTLQMGIEKTEKSKTGMCQE